MVGRQATKNLRRAFRELTGLSEEFHLGGTVMKDSAMVYRRAAEHDLVRGRSIVGMVAASLYLACRLTQTPLTLNDIAARSSVSKREIAGYYRTLVMELDIRMPVSDPALPLSRIASRAGLPGRTVRVALGILKKAEGAGATSGKEPVALAATALYVATVLLGDDRTQFDLAQAAGLTVTTIRNRYKDLKVTLGIEHPAKSVTLLPRTV